MLTKIVISTKLADPYHGACRFLLQVVIKRLPSKDGVIKTNRSIHLGDSKANVISKYGEANSNTFIMQSNVLYQFLLESSPAEAGIMRSQCSTYLAYTYENLGAIEFYFDENDSLSWVVFYAY